MEMVTPGGAALVAPGAAGTAVAVLGESCWRGEAVGVERLPEPPSGQTRTTMTTAAMARNITRPARSHTAGWRHHDGGAWPPTGAEAGGHGGGNPYSDDDDDYSRGGLM